MIASFLPGHGVFALLVVAVTVVSVSCTSSAPAVSEDQIDANPLPDLVIKRVGFQVRTTGSRLIPQRVEAILIPCAFRVQVDNVGSAAFDKPFYISFTTTLTDYQDFIYSKHELLNEGRVVILPRKSYTFVVFTEIEIPRRPGAIMMMIPVRFYINTEGALNKLGYQAPKVDERDYTNNTFELSLKIPRRQ